MERTHKTDLFVIVGEMMNHDENKEKCKATSNEKTNKNSNRIEWKKMPEFQACT